jgi:hypothetical protein
MKIMMVLYIRAFITFVQTSSTIFKNLFLGNNITANNIKSGNDRVSTVLMFLYTGQTKLYNFQYYNCHGSLEIWYMMMYSLLEIEGYSTGQQICTCSDLCLTY